MAQQKKKAVKRKPRKGRKPAPNPAASAHIDPYITPTTETTGGSPPPTPVEGTAAVNDAASSGDESCSSGDDIAKRVTKGGFGVFNDTKKMASAAKKQGGGRKPAGGGVANGIGGDGGGEKKKKTLKGDTDLDYVLVVDFECTCERNDNEYPHEIIEFPVVIVDCREMKVVEKWRRYVRPVRNPKLTAFCRELTKITQERVDAGKVLAETLVELHEWLGAVGMLEPHVKFAFATDGPWDFRDFYFKHAVMTQRAVPVHYTYFNSWIDVRKMFFHTTGNGGSLRTMLRYFRLPFLGQPHSGLDDSVNIAQVFVACLKAGGRAEANMSVDKATLDYMRENLERMRPPSTCVATGRIPGATTRH